MLSCPAPPPEHPLVYTGPKRPGPQTGGSRVTAAHWIAERAARRCLARHHPDWTQEELATCLGRSRSWVKKWLGRLDQAPPDDLPVLPSRSRARPTRPPARPPAPGGPPPAPPDAPPRPPPRGPGPRALRSPPP